MNAPGCYFKKIHNQLESGFNRAYRQYGLTSTQFDILMYLAQSENSHKSLTEIAAHFNVRHTSVIHVLNLLEKKGFIRRGTASQRARVKPIMLTEEGERIYEKVSQARPYLEQIMFAGISEEEQRQLERILKQICQNLDSDAFRNLMH